jgi:hypothetical protein
MAMAIGTAILLGVGLYLLAALPVAVVIGRLLGGPPAEVALTRAAGVPTMPAVTPPVRGTLAGGLVGAHVAATRPVALVARHAQAGAHLQLAGAEAHPAHA